MGEKYMYRDSDNKRKSCSHKPAPSVRVCEGDLNIVDPIAERRAWGLVMELVMRPLTHKFGQVEVAPGMSLSVPDATAFTWCVTHFRDSTQRKLIGGTGVKQKKKVVTNDVLQVKTRWRKSRAKTWVALVCGGSES